MERFDALGAKLSFIAVQKRLKAKSAFRSLKLGLGALHMGRQSQGLDLSGLRPVRRGAVGSFCSAGSLQSR